MIFFPGVLIIDACGRRSSFRGLMTGYESGSMEKLAASRVDVYTSADTQIMTKTSEEDNNYSQHKDDPRQL